MGGILVYISSGIFLTIILYVGLIIWDRNRIWSLLSNDHSRLSSPMKLDRGPRTVFDGSND